MKYTLIQMIYITQLLFVKKGEEHKFHEFENFAIPLMEKYNGKMLYRIRPEENSFVDENKELPYEVHLLTFDSEKDLDEFLIDDSRLNFIHLKEASVTSTFLIKGEKF